MSLVSVVLPTYDRHSYLKGAIETAINQTYNNIEVIVVYDGSTKEYAKSIVDSYSDQVKIITHDKNKGLSAARNTGIDESNGEFIAFLDDDDRWHKTKIQRQVMQLNKHGNAGLATCLVTSISPDKDIVHVESYMPNGDCSDELLIHNTIGTPSRVMVRKSVIQQIGGFDEDLPTKQDWDFYIRIAQNWTITGIKEHLCFRTEHKSMSSSVNSLKRDKEIILNKYKNILKDRGLWNNANASVSTEIARVYLRSGELRKARKHLKKATMLDMTSQRLLMLGLSHTHPILVKTTISTKRSISKISFNNDSYFPTEQIPGLVLSS